MLCAISGESPEVPVASRKSGNIFEKRLIEAYIAEHGTDPVNGEELTTDDLIELKTGRTVRPRPPTQTSIPALLATFQTEWDALALESFTLKQQLAQTRQELSTALYDFEGALRVIAKVSKERDDARDALARITVQGGRGGVVGGGGGEVAGGANGDAMQLDGQGLPEEVQSRVDQTQQELSSTRRKRKVPEDWVTANDFEGFEPKDIPTNTVVPSCRALAFNQKQNSALFGGEDGTAVIYDLKGAGKTKSVIKCPGGITDGLWWENQAIVSLSTGAIKIFKGAKEAGEFSVHAGPATGLALHPCGDILASVGSDRSYVLYDLSNKAMVSRVFADSELTCCQFHPDGHILATGGKDGQIKVFDVKTGQSAASFSTEGAVQALSFSENGTWLASASTGSTNVTIWDLRKAGDAARIKTLEFGSAIISLSWEYTGQFLAIAGAGCLAVEQYEKSSKKWTEPFKKATNARKAVWGASGKALLVDSESGGLAVWQ